MTTVWVAYYADMSGLAIFETELEALRHAVSAVMLVKMVTLPCSDLQEVLLAR